MRNGRRRESGQAAVLGMLCVFTLIVFVAMSTNTGTLSSDRTRFQNTMDATAYAGAFEQARILNKLTDINKEIVAAVDDLRELLNNREWRQPPCSCIDYSPTADAIIAAYQDRLDMLAAQFQYWNRAGQTTTKMAARRTGEANLLRRGAWQPFHLDFFQDNVNSATNWDSVVHVDRVETTEFSYLYTKSCRCCNNCCPYPGYIREPLVLTTWFYKNDPDKMVFFPAKMRGTPEKRFMDGPGEGYFGATTTGGMDMITNYAVGKPYDGKVGTPDPGNEGWGPTLLPGIEGSEFDNTNFRPEYKARMAGLQEPMSAQQGARPPVTVAGMINTDTWAPEFMGKGELFLH